MNRSRRTAEAEEEWAEEKKVNMFMSIILIYELVVVYFLFSLLSILMFLCP